MGDDPRARPEPFEVAEGLWLHAYQTLAARLPASDRPPRPRPTELPGLGGLPEPLGGPPVPGGTGGRTTGGTGGGTAAGAGGDATDGPAGRTSNGTGGGRSAGN